MKCYFLLLLLITVTLVMVFADDESEMTDRSTDNISQSTKKSTESIHESSEKSTQNISESSEKSTQGISESSENTKVKYRKCCGQDEKFDSETRECVKDNRSLSHVFEVWNITSNPINISTISDDSLQYSSICEPNDTALLRDYNSGSIYFTKLLTDGKLLVRNSFTGVHSFFTDYCVDFDIRTNDMITLLCNTTKKCCPENESYVSGVCQKSNETNSFRTNILLNECNGISMEANHSQIINGVFKREYKFLDRSYAEYYDDFCLEDDVDKGLVITFCHVMKKCCPPGQSRKESEEFGLICATSESKNFKIPVKYQRYKKQDNIRTDFEISKIKFLTRDQTEVTKSVNEYSITSPKLVLDFNDDSTCMEIFEHENDIVVLIESKNDSGDSDIIPNIASMFFISLEAVCTVFLVITSIIYSVVPGLNNMHGRFLATHTLLLALGFSGCEMRNTITNRHIQNFFAVVSFGAMASLLVVWVFNIIILRNKEIWKEWGTPCKAKELRLCVIFGSIVVSFMAVDWILIEILEKEFFQIFACIAILSIACIINVFLIDQIEAKQSMMMVKDHRHDDFFKFLSDLARANEKLRYLTVFHLVMYIYELAVRWKLGGNQGLMMLNMIRVTIVLGILNFGRGTRKSINIWWRGEETQAQENGLDETERNKNKNRKAEKKEEDLEAVEETSEKAKKNEKNGKSDPKTNEIEMIEKA